MKTTIRSVILSTALQITFFMGYSLADTVKIDLPTTGTYATVSEAYTAAADGATIKMQGTLFVEDMLFGEAKGVRLMGGYNSDFSLRTGNSSVNGTLVVSGGSVDVDGIIITQGVTVPGVPTGVTATAGATSSSVIVSFIEPADGGSPINGFTVNSYPVGITAAGSTSPVTVTCPAGCAGHSFSVLASNDIGSGAPSASVDVITVFDVMETFLEPQTQPNNTIFVGSFTFNSTTGTLTNLHGILSESMTGGSTPYPNDTMTWLTLNNQLISWYDATLGGTFAAVFNNSNTNTFWTGLGGDGWSPEAGIGVGGVYYGFPVPANNPGNAYALIFVPDNPLDLLTQAQIDKLAYADCAPGGIMGSVCMTGTAAAGYGVVGTMDGYPVSQTITMQ